MHRKNQKSEIRNQKSATAVFLDRDSTLIEDMRYSVAPAKLAPLPGVVSALSRLGKAGHKLVIITNQSGVARGTFSEEALTAFHGHMLAWFEERGVHFAGLYYCPHYPEGPPSKYVMECDCRKPAPGMILKAARELDIDMNRSWMVGDRSPDIAAGRAAGCRTIRILTGEPPAPGDPEPDFTAPDLAAAADYILNAGML